MLKTHIVQLNKHQLRLGTAIRKMSTISQPAYSFPLALGNPANHHPHTESTTTILVPNENVAFLNPVQQYNRDLSVSCIRAWNEIRKEEMEKRWRGRLESGKLRKKRKFKKGDKGRSAVSSKALVDMDRS